jgi:multiple sugar transport system substrate-binding protein
MSPASTTQGRPIRRREFLILSGLAATAAACTGTVSGGAGAERGRPATITFWHQWSQEHEVAAINANLEAFRKLHPEITVKTVGNVSDDKILQGIRSGNGPDVVSSFTTDNVGQFAKSGAWIDLAPLITRAGIDLGATFPKPVLEYTQYRGVRCALPLLADVWGLYYNQDMLDEAGLDGPPKTADELTEYAVKLTRYASDGSIERVGFMPNFRAYENSPWHLMAAWAPTYFDADGRSRLAEDPAVTDFLTWHAKTIKALGGYAKLEAFRKTFAEEFTPKNAFQAGKVALQIDGEWRTANMAQDKIEFGYGTAPLPVPEARADQYGGGYLSGTIIGIAKTSREQNAAWELTRFLTTDTSALVRFSDAIHNVPSTFDSLKASTLGDDPHFKPFTEMFGHEGSTTTPASPNGGAYLASFQDFAFRWEAGKVPDLAKGLAELDERINADIAQAGG